MRKRVDVEILKEIVMKNLGLCCALCFGFLLAANPRWLTFRSGTTCHIGFESRLSGHLLEKDWLNYGNGWRELGPGEVAIFETGDFNNRRNFWLIATGPQGDIWGRESRQDDSFIVKPEQASAPESAFIWGRNNRYATETLLRGDWDGLHQQESQFKWSTHRADRYIPTGMKSGFEVSIQPDGMTYVAWD